MATADGPAFADDAVHSLGGGDTPPLQPLARNRAFRIFWTGQSLAMLCGSVAAVALPLVVLDITGSVVQLGAVTAVGAISQLLAMTFGGGLVDRHRLRLMIGCEIGRGALFGVLVAAAALRRLDMGLVYGVVALTNILGALFSIAYQTVVKDTVRAADLLAANARLNVSAGISNVIGPVVGGLVLERIGMVAALSALMLANVVSAVSLVLIRAKRPPSPPLGGRPPLLSLAAGVRQIAGDRVLRATVPFTALAVFVSAATVDLLIFYLKRGLGAADASIGTVLSVSSLGFILAAVGAQAIRRRAGLLVTAVGALAIQGVCMIGIIGVSSVVSCMALGIAFVFGDTLRVIVVSTAEQERVPGELLGRVVAAKGFLLGLIAPLAMAVDTAAAGRWGPQVVMTINGGMAAAVAAGLLGQRALRRRSPTMRTAMKKKRRWWMWLIGCVAVAAVTLVVRQVLAGPKGTDGALLVKIKRSDLDISVMETGRIEPREKVDIKSKVPGQVARVLVRESETVTVGQPLLQIDPTDYDREVALRRADVAKATADMAGARNALAFARLNLERRQRGLQIRAVAQADVDLAVSEERAKRAAVQTAAAALDGVKVALQVARDRLRYTRIVSPMNGVVIQCGIKAGEVVVPGVQATFDDKALLAIADLSTLLVKINLNQIDVAKVMLGQPVTLTLDALPTRTYHAKITAIAASSLVLKEKQMEVFPVEATLTDADVLIKPGMTADVRIHVQQRPHVLSVPIEAVVNEKGKSYVNKVSYADHALKTTLVEVTVGAHNDRDIEIVNGVEEGEQVMIKPGSSAANEYNL